MYKEDLALNNLQWLICHKPNLTKPNQTNPPPNECPGYAIKPKQTKPKPKNIPSPVGCRICLLDHFREVKPPITNKCPATKPSDSEVLVL